MLNDFLDKLPRREDHHWVARSMVRDGWAEERVLAGMALYTVLDAVGYDFSTAPCWPAQSCPWIPSAKHFEAWHKHVKPYLKRHPILRMLIIEIAQRLQAGDWKRERDHLRHKLLHISEFFRRYAEWRPDPEDVREWYRQKARERAES